MVEYLIKYAKDEKCKICKKYEISCLLASSVWTNYMLIVNEFGNDNIIVSLLGLLNAVTRVVTGCLRTIKDTTFVVF